VQNQQLGGRVYSRHARPLVHRAQYIEGIIHAQEGSSMVAASRLGGIARFPYTVKGTREDNQLSENIYIHNVFVKTRFLKKTCS
jgi:hypothetical protein